MTLEFGESADMMVESTSHLARLTNTRDCTRRHVILLFLFFRDPRSLSFQPERLSVPEIPPRRYVSESTATRTEYHFIACQTRTRATKLTGTALHRFEPCHYRVHSGAWCGPQSACRTWYKGEALASRGSTSGNETPALRMYRMYRMYESASHNRHEAFHIATWISSLVA